MSGPGSPSRVALTRCAGYDPATVERALADVLEPLGGMRAFVGPGARVFLKVNLLMKAAPERAVTTHPEVVRAVIRAAKACGASEVAVGDSPGGRNSRSSFASSMQLSGIADVCREEGAEVVLLDDDTVRVPSPDSLLYPTFEVGRRAVEADVLISMPKLKTHGFMAFTGAVKNLFGCIPGLQKAQFHVKAQDRDAFAEMLVDLAGACRPALSIMDAVVGMEGAGPSSGVPRFVGALAASADPFALDVVSSAIAGFDPLDVYTVRAAHRRGGPASPDDVAVAGAPWRDLVVADFAHPAADPTAKMPWRLARWARRVLVARPWLECPAECTACGTCAKECPVDAIEMRDRRPSFDYDRCIRCYCCQELCPRHIIGLRRTRLASCVRQSKS